MLPLILAAAAAAGFSLLRGKTRKNPGRRPHKRRRVLRKKNPEGEDPSWPSSVTLRYRDWRGWIAEEKKMRGGPRNKHQNAVQAAEQAGRAFQRAKEYARLNGGLARGREYMNPGDDYVLKNRIAHLRGLIREAPAEDKVKLREILKSEQLKLMKPRKNPLYPVVMPKPDEVSDMSVREMREFLAEHNINGDSFGNKRLRKEVRRVIHKSVRRNPSEAFAQGEEIRKQVGSKALFMMGAKHLVAGSMESAEDGKSYPAFGFQVGRNAGKVTHVRIYLLPNDEYRVTFLAVRGTSARVVKNIDGVYADNLHSVLEDVTGMRMSLNPRKNPKKRRSTRKAKR